MSQSSLKQTRRGPVKDFLISVKVEELGVEVTDSQEDTITFKNTTDSNTLIKTLAKYDIDKLYVEQASIEDIFFHYYE